MTGKFPLVAKTRSQITVPSIQQQLHVSIAGWKSPDSLDSALELDCTRGDQGPTDLLKKLSQDKEGWKGLQWWLGLSNTDRPNAAHISLLGMDVVLRDKNQEILKQVGECISTSRRRGKADIWIVHMPLKKYLLLNRTLRLPDYEEEKSRFAKWGTPVAPSLSVGTGHTDDSATTWQRRWAGFHPNALDFVRANWRDLPDEPPIDFYELPPGIIRKLGSRESPTIFDRIWEDLDPESQKAITTTIRNQAHQETPELGLLKEFGFYTIDDKTLHWFSPLFEAYVYYYKTIKGIWWRIGRLGDFFDGVTDLMEKIRDFKPEVYVVRSVMALIILGVAVPVSRRIPNLWILMFVAFFGILLAVAALWPSLREPRHLFSSPWRFLTNAGVVIAGILYVYFLVVPAAQAISKVDQGQIGLALGIIQVLPMLFLLPKVIDWLSNRIGKIFK